MKIHLWLAVLVLGACYHARATGADNDTAAPPCVQCKSAEATAEERERAWILAHSSEPKTGWQHATDELAVEALEGEILRSVGKQTQEADYPEEARRWRWSGTTLIHVLMDGDGRMKALSVERTSGFRVLDDQALKMVQRVRSTRMPERLKGREVAVTVPIGFYFAH
jgi:TonB family protein